MKNENKDIIELCSGIYQLTKQKLKEIFYDMLYFPAGTTYSDKNTIEQKLK